MIRRATVPALLSIAIGLGSLGGCASSGSSYIHPGVDFGYMKRAAVLPFANLSSDDLADERVQSIFVMKILEEDVLEILDPRESLAALAETELRPGARPTPEQAVALGESLKVEALFFGTVEEYGVSRSDRNRGPEVTLVLEMIETETGVVVWRAQSHSTGASVWRRLFGGGPADLYSVSERVVADALGTLLE